MKKIVVLLPTFNEESSIESFTKAVLDQEKKLKNYRLEVLIVDSNSKDKSAIIAKRLSAQNPKVHFLSVERGLGVALVKGHQYSLLHLKPDILAQLDADNQVDPEILPRLVKVIESGYTLAIGSRFVKGGENQLSLSRRIFSAGASLICRVLMGPFDIKEFTNSARAFTPELFRKINLKRLPWKEKTFIVQPAFLNEAIIAGAKYKEIPLVFKDREEGYSKNKIVNYIYDIITYSLEMRLRKWGLMIPIFYLSRRAKTLIKFGVVGVVGTTVDFIFYNIFISTIGIRPATSKAFSTELAIINNFILNNSWTFRHRKNQINIWKKFGMFNLFSFGGLAISVAIVKILHEIYGDGFLQILGLNIPFYNIYFFDNPPSYDLEFYNKPLHYLEA